MLLGPQGIRTIMPESMDKGGHPSARRPSIVFTSVPGESCFTTREAGKSSTITNRNGKLNLQFCPGAGFIIS